MTNEVTKQEEQPKEVIHDVTGILGSINMPCIQCKCVCGEQLGIIGPDVVQAANGKPSISVCAKCGAKLSITASKIVMPSMINNPQPQQKLPANVIKLK